MHHHHQNHNHSQHQYQFHNHHLLDHHQHGQHHEIQTQIRTSEGLYRQMPMSDNSCPNRVTYSNNPISPPVRLSFVLLPDSSLNSDRICFNYGKELYIYVYKGVKKIKIAEILHINFFGDLVCTLTPSKILYIFENAPDLKKLIEKKMYKGVNPTCHDFNKVTMTNNSVSLLVGLSSGQIQLIDPIRRDSCRIYNEERLIDKTKVTCIRWVPGSTNAFIASHASGQLYVYNEDVACNSSTPSYQVYKQGDGYQIQTCKTKNIRNPIYRWLIGSYGETGSNRNDDYCINEFAFSPCGSNLAVVSQDGFLRVFDYHNMELLGFARSYFGGFLCVCWSPDGRYVVVGGQDDLVTIWSFNEKRVLARGQGHKSWVSVVAFDPFMTAYCGDNQFINGIESDESNSENEDGNCLTRTQNRNENQQEITTETVNPNTNTNPNICYRFGSVGQDTQLCMWDITEEVLNQPIRPKYRTSSMSTQPTTSATASSPLVTTTDATTNITITPDEKNSGETATGAATSEAISECSTNAKTNKKNHSRKSSKDSSIIENFNSGISSFTQKLKSLKFGDRKSDKKKITESKSDVLTNSSSKSDQIGPLLANNSSSSMPVSKDNSKDSLFHDPLRLIGTPYCPRFDQCPVIEPLVCEKIAQERLTALVFREDCFVTACQDGCIYTWARPNKAVS